MLVCHLGRSWVIWVPSWAPLQPQCCPLGALLKHLEAIGSSFVSSWALSGLIRESSWGCVCLNWVLFSILVVMQGALRSRLTSYGGNKWIWKKFHTCLATAECVYITSTYNIWFQWPTMISMLTRCATLVMVVVLIAVQMNCSANSGGVLPQQG